MNRVMYLLYFCTITMLLLLLGSRHDVIGETLFQDDFAGQKISSNWSAWASEGCTVSQNDKLIMNIVEGVDNNAGAKFVPKVYGDFDITVDYTDLHLINPGSYQVVADLHITFESGESVQMSRTNGVWGNRYISTCIFPGMGSRSPCWDPTWTSTTASSGTFKMSRRGAVITLNYSDNEGKSNAYIFNGPSSSATVFLRLYSYISPGSNSHVSWDNFDINAYSYDPIPEESESEEYEDYLSQCEQDLSDCTQTQEQYQADLTECNRIKDQCQVDLNNSNQYLNECNSDNQICQEQKNQFEEELSTCTQQIGDMEAALSDMVDNFRKVFNDSEFNIPGNTQEEKIQNLIQAVQELNKGRKKGIYDNLK